MMGIVNLVIIWLTKFICWFFQILRLGSGKTWPGEVALRLNPRFLSTFDFFGKSVIFVLGTNGKTTTSKMIQVILTRSGRRVVVNDSGANLENGIASALIANVNWSGELTADIYVFEIDEASLERVIKYIKPTVIVLLNLFRDQLDRYGEVDSIAGKWSDVLKRLDALDPGLARMTQSPSLIINGDDPQLAYLGSLYKGEVKYFGINNPDLFLSVMQHATDSIHCPKCGKRLTFGGVYFSHLGKYACGQCGFTHPKMSLTAKDVLSPLPGVYNLYNVMAAILVTQHFHLSIDEIKKALVDFKPAFGRSEKLDVNGKTVKIMLSKNPTGFNESLRTAVDEGAKNFLLVLNDRIPDGRDVSWIWDVDFEMLAEETRINAERGKDADQRGKRKRRGSTRIVVSGERADDMGVRLKYAFRKDQNVKIKMENDNENMKNFRIYSFEIEEDLSSATKRSLGMLDLGETLYIMPTYSAMLEVRKILTGKKIL